MVIHVLNLVPDCYSWENGDVLCRAISDPLKSGQKVTLSFEGVQDIPSSFVNGAFVPLVESFGLPYVKSHLSIVKSTRQINDIIKHRLESEQRRGEAQNEPFSAIV